MVKAADAGRLTSNGEARPLVAVIAVRDVS
jgi:hypothetical protein